MPTVVNTTSDRSSGFGWIIGALIFLVAVVLFIMYGIPAMNRAANSGSSNTPAIDVPDEVDVNVQQQPAQ